MGGSDPLCAERRRLPAGEWRAVLAERLEKERENLEFWRDQLLAYLAGRGANDLDLGALNRMVGRLSKTVHRIRRLEDWQRRAEGQTTR